MRVSSFIVSISLSLTFFPAMLPAQQPEARAYTSASDVQALIAKAKKERKEDQANFSQLLVALAPYRANLEYRPIVGTAAVHEHEAELFYVVDGSATLVTGGKLIDEKRTNADNLAGSGIEGGATRQVAKGDFFMVPENTPHIFSKISDALVLMTLHLPRPLPAGH